MVMKLTAIVPPANFYFFVEIMIQDRADTAAYIANDQHAAYPRSTYTIYNYSYII